MTAAEIRQRFLDFFRARGHAVLPSASLVPENDPTVLFTTAGMQPLTPYLLGEPHPAGRRLASVQKCVRVQDIDEVGDARHDTFFEMLGNWSLGDYFKLETIAWSFEFATGHDGLSLDPRRIVVSVFSGDADAPRDDEAIALWREQFARFGLSAEVRTGADGYADSARIYLYGKEKNWWGPVGETGPCGPDTELFYDLAPASAFPGGHFSQDDVGRFGPRCHPNCDCGRFVEFWNDVFMEYQRTTGGRYSYLKQKNVDTGMGLERVAMIVQGDSDIFSTDLFAPVMEQLQAAAARPDDTRSLRIVADHLRTAVFLVADGVTPSNVDRGYVLRRLLRRALRFQQRLGLPDGISTSIVERFCKIYAEPYPEVLARQEIIKGTIAQEEVKFDKTLAAGLKEFERVVGKRTVAETLSGEEVFRLFSTYGFPVELTVELAQERGLPVDVAGIEAEWRKHQESSRAGSARKFAGGLADHSERTVRMHTATHLLHEALRRVLGPHVEQRGSNITPERLRFDFTHECSLTTEELRRVEELVNEQVDRDLTVTRRLITPAEALAEGAIGLFGGKYGEVVSVYTVGDFSKEICGGPHVSRTREIGHFRILKEEGLSAGIRRIRAVVE